MKNLIYGLVLFASLSFGLAVSASDEHGHDHAAADEHEEADEHGHNHEDSHEEEASPLVGAEKGITEKSSKGFKLSNDATKSFGIEIGPLAPTVEVEKKSILTIKDAKFIYRVRDNWISKTPIQILSGDQGKIKLSVSAFAPGDKMITQGVGFVRTSELLLEQGASHGHSH